MDTKKKVSWYKGKPEKKINKMLTLSESVVDEVEKRLQRYGGKMSSLVQNLLVSWCAEYDILHKDKKKEDSKK